MPRHADPMRCCCSKLWRPKQAAPPGRLFDKPRYFFRSLKLQSSQTAKSSLQMPPPQASPTTIHRRQWPSITQTSAFTELLGAVPEGAASNAGGQIPHPCVCHFLKKVPKAKFKMSVHNTFLLFGGGRAQLASLEKSGSAPLPCQSNAAGWHGQC